MPGWKERLTQVLGGGQLEEALDPDLCLDPPAGVSAEQRAAYCTALIARGDPAMRARFHNALGLAYRDLGRENEGRAEIDRAIAMEPRPLFLANRAYIAYKDGRIDAALVDLDRAIGIDPEFARAYEDRADVFYAIDRAEDGLRDIDRALALAKPTDYRLYRRGALLMELGRHTEAIEALSASLELDPGFANALERRGTAHLMLDEMDRAVADFQAALARKPEMQNALISLGSALEASEPQKALTYLDRALAREPDNAPAVNNRSTVLDRLGDHAAAGAGFDRAVTLAPDEPAFRNNRALWRIEAGDFQGAQADLEWGLEQAPGDAGMFCAQAHLAVIRGDSAQAEQMLLGLLAERPNHADANSILGWACLGHNRLEPARAALDRALGQPEGARGGKQNHRIRWVALYGRGLCRQRAGEVPGGEADLMAARDIRPDADAVVARWSQGEAAAATQH